jgi:hypothetical protein
MEAVQGVVGVCRLRFGAAFLYCHCLPRRHNEVVVEMGLMRLLMGKWVHGYGQSDLDHGDHAVTWMGCQGRLCIQGVQMHYVICRRLEDAHVTMMAMMSFLVVDYDGYVLVQSPFF